MTNEQLGEMLSGLIGKTLTSVAVAPEFGVIMLSFPEGKTLYVSGEKLSIDVEAAS